MARAICDTIRALRAQRPSRPALDYDDQSNYAHQDQQRRSHARNDYLLDVLRAELQALVFRIGPKMVVLPCPRKLVHARIHLFERNSVSDNGCYPGAAVRAVAVGRI